MKSFQDLPGQAQHLFSTYILLLWSPSHRPVGSVPPSRLALLHNGTLCVCDVHIKFLYLSSAWCSKASTKHAKLIDLVKDTGNKPGNINPHLFNNSWSAFQLMKLSDICYLIPSTQRLGKKESRRRGMRNRIRGCSVRNRRGTQGSRFLVLNTKSGLYSWPRWRASAYEEKKKKKSQNPKNDQTRGLLYLSRTELSNKNIMWITDIILNFTVALLKR